MPVLKPLPKKVYDKLKKDIEKTHLNEGLIERSISIMKKLLEERE